MQKIKTETIMEKGTKMTIDYYSEDGTTVSATVKIPVSDESVPMEPLEEYTKATQLDRIEAQTAYIAMMMDGGEM